MFIQILNLTWKELIQLRRDRFLMLFLIVAPTLQLVLLSHNAARGVRDLTVAVLDLDQSNLSRELVAMVDNTREMRVLYHPRHRQDLEQLIADGLAQVGLVIPPSFTRDFYRLGPQPAQLQAILDGSNLLVGSNGGRVLEGVVQRFIADHLGPAAEALDLGGVEVVTTAAFNPAFDYRWFTLPSMLVFITYQVALVVAATGFVREKELGTLEQLIVTPLRRPELIIGKALPAVVVAFFNFLVLYAVIRLGYGVPMRGAFALLVGTSLLFVLAVVAQGTLVSVLTHTQQQAVLIVFLMAILEVTLSGYLLPVENMPLVMRGLAQVSALQHHMTLVRAIILRGATLPMIGGHVLALAAFAVVGYAVAWRTFTRSL
ncbi:MAG: ABC transporter permease [Caldilineales bacterium]|nr:ABC transporter permease [Caldilineales bacterium]